MIIDIHAQGFTVTRALADHVRRRLGSVVRRHSDRMQRVSIRVGDENGPRGGVDKFCRIQVHLIGAPVAVIGDVGADLYAVIDRATARVGRVVVKNLDRTHPVRDAARHGMQPARHRHEIQEPTRAHGDIG